MQTNRELELAYKIIENTGHSLFLTGKAGTGKTTFLRDLRRKSRKQMVVTAPTGIAAINAGGVTLHSFFQLDFGPFVPGMKRQTRRPGMAFNREKLRIIRGMDVLVIDEISMVRADLLDAVDDVLRRLRDYTKPFGGVQLLMIGDLQQLPPVVRDNEAMLLSQNYRSPYFFDSHALASTDYVTVELQKVYRQSDTEFLDILNAVRDNRVDAGILARLNSRCISGFNPADNEGYVRLTTHNHLANDINRNRMEALTTMAHYYEAQIEGNFPESSFPADKTLILKEGAQVMFIKNDTGMDRRYFNGMLGRVTGIDEDGTVYVQPTDSTDQIPVEPASWENKKFKVDEETKQISETCDGVFTQLPLKPAWAVTIHKSQGLTFDRAIIDASASFAHGQTYVALSRCRTLDGLVLERPIEPRAIICDSTVTGYLNTQTAQTPDENTLDSLTHSYKLNTAADMFNFRPIFGALEGVARLYIENFSRIYPTKVSEFSNSINRMNGELTSVCDRFKTQIYRLDAEAGGSDDNPKLSGRLKDASRYFLTQLTLLTELVNGMPTDHDNYKVRQKLDERLGMFASMAAVKHQLLACFSEADFGIDRYLEIKATASLGQDSTRRARSRQYSSVRPAEASDDNVNPVLFDMLRRWRKAKADELDAEPYMIMGNKPMMYISNEMPQSNTDLLAIPGIGPSTVSKYGEDILELIGIYLDNEPEAKRLVRRPQKQNASKHGKKINSSVIESYNMFRAGMNVPEIAKRRNLKESTIFGHLLDHLDPSDRESYDRLISPEALKITEDYIAEHPDGPFGTVEILMPYRQQHENIDSSWYPQVRAILKFKGLYTTSPAVNQAAESQPYPTADEEPVSAVGEPEAEFCRGFIDSLD